ncbi:MAG: DEAD/DEAH box helicase, partial [Bifidobacteriaceae bacterium]|nr:DEAD/DEAH box helicase [Bifidobacteriaceae bacterium]
MSILTLEALGLPADDSEDVVDLAAAANPPAPAEPTGQPAPTAATASTGPTAPTASAMPAMPAEPAAQSAPAEPPASQSAPAEPPAAAAAAQPAVGFTGLGLPDDLLETVADLGFTTPTEIQSAVIPLLMGGHDVVGVAQTGTGKTAAFGLPLVAGVDPAERRPQALVLAPTRELAMQLADAIKSFARRRAGVRVAIVYGGASYVPQRRDLEAGAQIVVGTPGRVIDHLERGTLVLDGLRRLILDEADEMLRMGFAEDVDTILAQAPSERQTALFSATMPSAIRATADRHLRSPQRIAVSAPASAPALLDQRYVLVPARHKVEALIRTLATATADAAIVFVRTRDDADRVSQDLISRGVNAAGISGEVAQRERERIVERLRQGQLDVLVATDVAARGMDVERIGLVVNFDVPRDPEVYVHRVGRTGRAGRTGVAVTFIAPGDRGRLRAIERTIRGELDEWFLPTLAEVADHQYASLMRRVSERLTAGRLDAAYRAVGKAIEAGADPVALAAALAALAVGAEAGVDGRRMDAEEFDRAVAESRDRGGRERGKTRDRDRSGKRGRDAGDRSWRGGEPGRGGK